jgi:hypothetical protein
MRREKYLGKITCTTAIGLPLSLFSSGEGEKRGEKLKSPLETVACVLI